MGESERRRPLERPRFRGEYNIKMNNKQIGWENMGWIYLA
jgi:hypothetical protein